MKYFMTCFLVLCAAQCFAEELIVRYWDSTFFYTNLDDKRTDYSCNLKTLGQALDTAHKGNRTCWRRLDANNLVLYADVYDDMTMQQEHLALRVTCRGMFHVTVDRLLVNGRELFGHAMDAVVTRLLRGAEQMPASDAAYKFLTPERGTMCRQ